jgi:hypothetical protein
METKIITSSKTISVFLKDIDFRATHIIATEIREDSIILHFEDFKVIQIPSVLCKKDFSVTQSDDLRWDWIFKLCNQINEQPILLTLTPNSVNLTTQY